MVPEWEFGPITNLSRSSHPSSLALGHLGSGRLGVLFRARVEGKSCLYLMTIKTSDGSDYHSDSTGEEPEATPYSCCSGVGPVFFSAGDLAVVCSVVCLLLKLLLQAMFLRPGLQHMS